MPRAPKLNAVGRELEAARKAAGLTKEGLAQRLQVSTKTLGRRMTEEPPRTTEEDLQHMLAAISGRPAQQLPNEARTLVEAFKLELARGGGRPEDLHYVEQVLMEPHLPPHLFGGHVAQERLLKHVQGMIDELREFFRDFGYRLA